MSWTCNLSFSFTSPSWLLRKKFLNMFSKIYHLCCHGNQSNSAIWTKFMWIVEDYSRNVKKKKFWISAARQQKLSISTFPIISHRVLIRLEQKTQLFVPPAYRCYMWNMERIPCTASKEMSFEKGDRRRTTRQRRRRDNGCLPIL